MESAPEIKNVLDRFGTEVVERAMRNLGAERVILGKRRRRVASGLLRDSLTYNFNETGSTIYMGFFANNPRARRYADVIERGRKPNSKQPPVDDILKWMKVKGVRLQKKGGGFIKQTESGKRSAAFAIARSIGKRGIPGIHYMEQALTETLQDFGPEFIEALKKELAIRLKLT